MPPAAEGVAPPVSLAVSVASTANAPEVVLPRPTERVSEPVPVICNCPCTSIVAGGDARLVDVIDEVAHRVGGADVELVGGEARAELHLVGVGVLMPTTPGVLEVAAAAVPASVLPIVTS